jgi:hypothetical protein
MALAAAAFSNEGEIPTPQILLRVADPQGGWGAFPPLGTSQSPFIATVANRVANDLADESITFWRTLALAYNGPNQPLTWFVGGTLPGAEQPLVLVVLLETQNPGIAEFIGETLLTLP